MGKNGYVRNRSKKKDSFSDITPSLKNDSEADIGELFWSRQVGKLSFKKGIGDFVRYTQQVPVFVTQDTGTLISFDSQKIYNTYSAPGTTDISDNLTDAAIGVTQKIYHNSLIAPSMPLGWTLIGEGFYVPGELNIIYAEWCGNTRVEYWITQ